MKNDLKINETYHLVLELESICLIAFGFSELVKEEFLFMKDER